MAGKPQQQNTPPAVNLSKIDQAAILLMSMGEASAAEVLKHMGPKEVQALGTAMASLSNVQQNEVEVVLNNFMEEVRTQTGLGMGADGYIRNMLVSALGEDKAHGLIDRILLGGSTTGLDTLKWMEARSIADIIRNEHPQIQAIVIAYLDADQSAEVLTYFPEKVQLDVMLRVASLDTVHCKKKYFPICRREQLSFFVMILKPKGRLKFQKWKVLRKKCSLLLGAWPTQVRSISVAAVKR